VVASIGPLATISREPGQARKGAATAVDLCAEGVLVEVASISFFEFFFLLLLLQNLLRLFPVLVELIPVYFGFFSRYLDVSIYVSKSGRSIRVISL